MILTGLTACDNVEWGGVEFRLQAPSTRDVEAAPAVEEGDPDPPPLDVAPALYLVDRSGPAPRLVPVALLGDDGLQPFSGPEEMVDFPTRFAEERMSEGRRFVLFAGGARVGSFHPRQGTLSTIEAPPSAGPSSDAQGGGAPSPAPAESFGFLNGAGPWCATRPSVGGWLEVLPDLPESAPLLGLPAELAEDRPRRDYVPRSSSQAERTGSLNVASRLFQSEGIIWPPNIVEARADIQVFRTPDANQNMVASTFLYGDALATGPAPPNGYSLFFIAEPAAQGRYEAGYIRYREVGVDGKSAPRFVGHADWDGDGRTDVLLEIFGERGRSFAALTEDDEGWSESYSEGCALSAAGSLAE